MKLWSLAALVLVPGGALADDGQHAGRPHTHWWLELEPAWYAGATASQTAFDAGPGYTFVDDGSLSAPNEDETDLGWRVFAGLDLNEHLAVEVGYADFGEVTRRGQSDGSGFFWAPGPVTEGIAVEAMDFSLLGKLPLAADFAVFGKLGKAH